MEQNELNEMSVKHELLRRNAELGVLMTKNTGKNETIKNAAEDLIKSSLALLSKKLKDL